MLRWQVASPLVVLVEANGFLFSTPTSFLISLSHLFFVSPTLPPLPHRHNFDVRKGPISSEWFVGAGKKEGLFCVKFNLKTPDLDSAVLCSSPSFSPLLQNNIPVPFQRPTSATTASTGT